MYETTLKTTQLGQTGLDITRVGFGAWAIGGGGWEFGWGPQDDDRLGRANSCDQLLAAAISALRRRRWT